MSDTDLAYPLTWPAGFERAPIRERARFDTAFAAARDGLLRELELLGARHITISSNVPLKRDGMPYATRLNPDDPAVAVYFELERASRCIPCDTWDRVQDNVQAIRLTVAALRGIERWGSRQIVAAAFSGFAALPAGGTIGRAWWDVLECSPLASPTTIEAAYRRLARYKHPDLGGSAAEFAELAEAYRVAKAYRHNRERQTA